MYAGRHVPSGQGRSPAVLVQSIGGLGNTLMATPLLRALRLTLPEARIDLITSPGAAELLAGAQGVDRIVIDPLYTHGGLRLLRAYRRLLAEEGYDWCIHTLNAVIFKGILGVAATRIPRRVGHAYSFSRWEDHTRLFTDVVPIDPSRHDVENNLQLLRPVLGSVPNSGALELTLPEESFDEARTRLAERGWDPSRPTIGLSPGSSGWMSFKRWPEESYRELARRLLGEGNEPNVMVLCGPDEADAAERWRESLGDRVIVVEGLPIRAFAATLRCCDVVVCNDSLPVHLCAALGVPTVALYGPTDPARTGPWRAPGVVVTPEGDWRPWFHLPNPPDPATQPDYMARIGVDRVFRETTNMLAG